jgi:hypothetical protein
MSPLNILISCVSTILPRVSIANLLYFVGSLWVLYEFVTILYNISCLHPLSQFPGPKLAAATLCYEAWFDVLKVGRYTRKIGEMHEKYGTPPYHYTHFDHKLNTIEVPLYALPVRVTLQ